MVLLTDDIADFCEVEWRRQKTFDHIEQRTTLKKPKTGTPVVELQPFRQKEWSREKSLPQMDLSPRHEESRLGQEYRLPKAPIQTVASPQVHVINLADQTFPKVSCIHPQVDPRPYWGHQHQQGFTTLGERTKSTLEEIRSGNCVSKSFSCLKQALSPRDVSKIQDIHLRGAKMRKDIGKRRLQYLDPWEKYDRKRMFSTEADADNNYSKSKFYQDMKFNSSSLERLSKEMANSSFNVSVSLPSLHINHSTSNTSRGRQPTRSRSGKRMGGWCRTGGIKNSFQIMIENGPQATIEKQLTMELELKLKDLRHNREPSIYNANTTPLRKFQQVTYRSGPTAGEVHLQRGLALNSRRSGRDTDGDCAGGKSTSRPTTEAKTECRDSGIQSPVGSDEDSVSAIREPADKHPEQLDSTSRPEGKVSSQIGFEGGNQEEKVSINAEEEIIKKEISDEENARSPVTEDRLTVVSVTREDTTFDDQIKDSSKPKLNLPELSPSALPLV